MYLTQDQRDAYERDGFIILRDLVSSDEVGRIKRDLARACDLRDDQGGPRDAAATPSA